MGGTGYESARKLGLSLHAHSLSALRELLEGCPFYGQSPGLGRGVLKTFFLVCLASGRRVIEIYGRSGLSSDVAFEADGSASLRFLPECLAKNQVPGDLSPILFIKPLSSILPPDDPDLANCPVRALKVFLAD
jgi:hypothetical protein